ncbi:MAG TPA: NADH-quinone oxidoreductase subunit C [Pseudonocardiaceae bacterium]|jgi:NADH-quinone oxidoreductase subunit C
MTPAELSDAFARGPVTPVASSVDHGVLTVDVDPADWLAAAGLARDGLACDFFDWLSAVDEQEAGLRMVLHVYSTSGRHHLLLRTLLAGTPPELPTVTGIYRGANWHERETAEMFGIRFDGHPNPVPLLLPDGFEGHPLRKDFVLASRVAKQWPGEVDPGQSVHELATGRQRRRNLPPGVPDPKTWGPEAQRTRTAGPEAQR